MALRSPDWARTTKFRSSLCLVGEVVEGPVLDPCDWRRVKLTCGSGLVVVSVMLAGGHYQQIPAIRHSEPAVIAGFHRLLAGDNPQEAPSPQPATAGD